MFSDNDKTGLSKFAAPVGPRWSWTHLAATPQLQRGPQTCGWSQPWERTGSAAPAWKLCSSCPVNKERNFTCNLLHMKKDCRPKAWWLRGLSLTHRVTLALLQDSFGQMVVEKKPLEHRQMEEWLQQDSEREGTAKNVILWFHSNGVVLQYKKLWKMHFVSWSTWNTVSSQWQHV